MMNGMNAGSGGNLSDRLCGLYGSFGYSRYKMNKFEEYDLYARNKDFLVADSVITFTDTNGKLMALKPDVTLSIAKNCRDLPGTVSKLYYDESVYRVSKGTNSFKEIRQLGVECTGDVDDYCILETLSLALEGFAPVTATLTATRSVEAQPVATPESTPEPTEVVPTPEPVAEAPNSASGHGSGLAILVILILLMSASAIVVVAALKREQLRRARTRRRRAARYDGPQTRTRRGGGR